MNTSIVVPMHNAEKTISKCIKSLLDQEFPGKFEIILVDDASTDKSVEVASSFNVRVVKQGKKGPAAARNLGAEKAKYEIICFIDSDCIAQKNWLNEITAAFSNKNVAGVQGTYISKQKEIVARLEQIEIEQRYAQMKKYNTIDHIGTYSCAYLKKVFLDENGFDESFPIASGEDIEFSYRLAAKGYLLLFRPDAKVEHFHETSLSKYFKKKFYRAYYRVLLYKLHKSKVKKDSYTPNTVKFQIGFFYLFALSIVYLGLGHILAYQPLYGDILVILSLLLILVSVLDFFFFAVRKSAAVAITSLPIMFLRVFVFGLGFSFGILKGGK